MTQMHNVVFGTISLGFATLLAFYQSAMSTEFAIIKDLGMGGAFIVTCFFMFRYFTKQIEDKDKEQKELTEKFMQVAEKAIEREKENGLINQQVLVLLNQIRSDSHNGRKGRESRT